MVVAAGDPGECLAHGVAHGVLPLLHGDVEVHEHEGAVGQELGTGGPAVRVCFPLANVDYQYNIESEVLHLVSYIRDGL